MSGLDARHTTAGPDVTPQIGTLSQSRVKDLPEPPRSIYLKPITDEEFQNARLFSLGNGRYYLSFNAQDATLNPTLV